MASSLGSNTLYDLEFTMISVTSFKSLQFLGEKIWSGTQHRAHIACISLLESGYGTSIAKVWVSIRDGWLRWAWHGTALGVDAGSLGTRIRSLFIPDHREASF
jgi:hypothetical protein